MRYAVIMVGIAAVLVVVLGFMPPFRVEVVAPVPTAVPTTAVCDLEHYFDAMQPLIQEWDDASALASQTARLSLALPVSKMQEARRRVAQMDVPDCALAAHGKLTAAMDVTIQAYMDFMAQESDAVIQEQFQKANQLLKEYWQALAAIEP